MDIVAVLNAASLVFIGVYYLKLAIVYVVLPAIVLHVLYRFVGVFVVKKINTFIME